MVKLISLLVLFLAGCGKGGSSSTRPSAAPLDPPASVAPSSDTPASATAAPSRGTSASAAADTDDVADAKRVLESYY